MERQQKPTPKKYNQWSEWILKNEYKMNHRLNEIRKEYIQELDTSARTMSISEAFTQYDTSILGEFVKMVLSYDSCINVSYTFYKNPLQKKTMILFRDDRISCKHQLFDSNLIQLNETKYFVIQNELNDSSYRK